METAMETTITVADTKREMRIYNNDTSVWVEGSSAVSNLHYFANSKCLYIVFTSGGQYRYENVPMNVFMMVMLAESIGKAVAEYVKGGGYEYEKVRD